jgi:hypothetical protein
VVKNLGAIDHKERTLDEKEAKDLLQTEFEAKTRGHVSDFDREKR